ncbi:aminopeptidase P family protein [Natroniella sulfidigena]|uniref:M24 family metallopeptidase n=1 Tax=Natroniella sulfidigena TaxID=723921 RepID=UPI00200A8A26|nr:aminopeptidase P family protein [Natroniella sulfidigena]MCK8817496.1 aminopeptidase P family protein [Natroniella sulfidigena]
MEARIERLRAKLTEKELDALLVNNPANRRYLSGFTGTAGSLLISQQEALLITDFRYTEQAQAETTDYEIIEFKDSKLEMLNQLVTERQIEVLGFEAEHETYDQYLKYQDEFELELRATKGLVKELRRVKEQSEVTKIKEAVQITEEVFAEIQSRLQPGVIEREIAAELEYLLRKKGARGKSFDFIVASGKRSALPHGVASEKKIEAGDLLTIDFGCLYQGYCSDMTRTVAIKDQPTEKQEEIYHTVLEAQQESLKGIKPGVKASAVDQIAREIITEAGYGDYFGHGLGHSVGLEIHEEPRFSPKDDTILEAGMVITVEPGIYLPDWGGVRIEDIVVVTEDGCQILNQFSKELIVV